MSKYDVPGSQGAYQSGSSNTVLANKLGIFNAAEMDEVEMQLLAQLYQAVLIEDLPDRQITCEDLKAWHRLWLGNVYDWAGEERGVNMSKGDFHFAVTAQIPKLLGKLERDYLAKFTPCDRLSQPALVDAIATVHVEFILIHPFREGNGRLSRLLADVMAVQAGYQPLDYSLWEVNKSDYFKAIQLGVSCNYEPMARLVAQALV